MDKIIRTSISWDVMSGVARRAWARNETPCQLHLNSTGKEGSEQITLLYLVMKESSAKRLKKLKLKRRNEAMTMYFSKSDEETTKHFCENI